MRSESFESASGNAARKNKAKASKAQVATQQEKTKRKLRKRTGEASNEVNWQRSKKKQSESFESAPAKPATKLTGNAARKNKGKASKAHRRSQQRS